MQVLGRHSKSSGIRRIKRLSDEGLEKLGLRRIHEGILPAEDRFKQGIPKTTKGDRRLDPRAFRQITFEKQGIG